jgi:hypothetical protein
MTLIQRLGSLIAAAAVVAVVMFPVAAHAARMIA